MAKAWRDYRVQPWRSESFRFSTDPELVAKVTAALKPRHRHQEFLAFLEQVARAYSDGELHW